MDSRQMMNEQLKKKNHGKTMVESKYVPRFPESAERDYIRFVQSYVQKEFKAQIQDFMPELMQILTEAEKTQPRANQKFTGRTDAKDKSKENAKERARLRRELLAAVMVKLDDWFERLKGALKTNLNVYEIRSRLNRIANASRKLTVKEWKKAIGKTLGINLLEDYFDGDFYAEAIERWINENVDLIVTIPTDSLDNMKKIILDTYLSGKPITAIVKEIEHNYSVTKAHARLIARDQMGKLNCQITRHQQLSCGVRKYKWRTAKDSRVRDTHKALEGRIFDWDNPPVVDRNGRRCHPGQDYQCRCIAVPVFEFDKLDLPVDGRITQRR